MSDRCLLARGADWPVTQFSTLAGFIEPGESLEQAVAREVLEEVGVRVADPIYVGSQPHPFPSSLMLGFTARAVTTDIHLDQSEIAEARWLSRDALRSAVDSGEMTFAPSVSISRRLVEAWYGGPLWCPQPNGGSVCEGIPTDTKSRADEAQRTS